MMSESVFLFYCGGVVFMILLAISGAVVGFTIIKIAQRSATYITNSDVAAVTRGWAIGFGLGALIGFVFLGIVDVIVADYITSALYVTVAFGIIGISVGLIGVRPMFERLAKYASTSESSTSP